MSRFFKTNIKIGIRIVLLIQFFAVSVLPVSAGIFPPKPPAIPNPSQFFSDGEKRYNIDPEAVRNQGQFFNTADNKKPTPQLSMFFSPTDPKAGEKLSAKAFPMYFTDTEKTLYYTWYLKRAECALTNSPSANVEALCDADGDSNITVEDWKVTAARILVQNGFDSSEANYANDTDNDGYKAVFGGSNQVGVNNHCYINDPKSGKNYELGDGGGTINYACPSGQVATCLEDEQAVSPGTINNNPDPSSPPNSDPTFVLPDSGICNVTGNPVCRANGSVFCSVGYPRCVADLQANPIGCGTALSSCTGGGANFNPSCKHLFPKAPGFTAGDGTFGASEENFWKTNPTDPDTADNGNKDEANVVGLAQNDFVWNYIPGDQVGVVVEGTSMITTKYDDSSSMIMWAFSKNDCPIGGANTKSFFKQIRGYQVEIPAVDLNLNDCLERNLVDPTQGGQSTGLEVSVSASPDSPLNDESVDGSGDVISAQASVANSARGISEIQFDWTVEIANNPQFANGGTLVSAPITADLQGLKLIGGVKGVALDALNLKLDIRDDPAYLLDGKQLSYYLESGIGYLRFTAKTSENFASGAVRKGKSDVVVKFTSSKQKIEAYKSGTILTGTAMQVALPTPLNSGRICNDDPLDRVACRIIKNEIIGLRVDPSGLTNFQWAINGDPLTCSRGVVSPDCEKNASGGITIGEQNFVNFFPVTGEVGSTYTVTLNANDVKTGKTVTLSRAFHVVEPTLLIQSTDLTTAWPKFVGQYRDVDGAGSIACPNGMCNQYSTTIFGAFSTQQLVFKAEFIPNFLAGASKRQWTVDGALLNESTPMSIAINALKEPYDVYNISLVASLAQSQEARRALRDIWGISPLESTEIRFSTAIQAELIEPGFAQGTLLGTKKYLAALASYIPTSVMFTFRIVLSVILILFTARFLLVLAPASASMPQRYRRS